MQRPSSVRIHWVAPSPPTSQGTLHLRPRANRGSAWRVVPMLVLVVSTWLFGRSGRSGTVTLGDKGRPPMQPTPGCASLPTAVLKPPEMGSRQKQALIREVAVPALEAGPSTW